MLDLKLKHLSQSSKVYAGVDVADKLSQTIFRDVGKDYRPVYVVLGLQIIWDFPFVEGFKRFFFQKHGPQAEDLYKRYIG